MYVHTSKSKNLATDWEKVSVMYITDKGSRKSKNSKVIRNDTLPIEKYIKRFSQQF
jgi:hypothetical protein